MINKILQEKFKDCDYTYAFQGCNSEPKRVGKQYLESNINNIVRTLDYIMEAAEVNKDDIMEAEKFIDDYKIKMDKCASIRSRIYSPLIQGPANFPFARMEKLMDRERAANQELEKFVDKFKLDMIKKYSVTDTSQVIDDLIADYYKSIELGCTKSLAVSSLRGKLVTQAKNGLAVEVKKAISDYKIFTARNKIHKVIDEILSK